MVTSASRERARAGAALFGAGGLLGGATVLVANWDTLDRPRITAVVVAALAVAVLLRWRDHLGSGEAHALCVLGTVAIATGEVLGGGGAATATIGILHSFVAIYACAMTGRAPAAAQIVFIAVAQFTALTLLGEQADALGQVLLTVGASASTGAVVGVLMAQVRRLAASDPLTGLANRRAADEGLLRAQADAQRTGNPLCVAVLDLDAFKQLNDTAGHATGDRVLQQAARNWSAELRAGDLLARTGGDEFLAVLGDCDLDRGATIAGRLWAVTPSPVRCSIGLAVWDAEETMERLLARADAALYVRKREGRDGVQIDRSRTPARVASESGRPRS